MVQQTKTNEENIKNKKFKFWQYFKPYKGTIFVLLLMQVFYIVRPVIDTLLSAQFFVYITEGFNNHIFFWEAAKLLIIITMLQLLNFVINHLNNRIYFKLEIKVSKAMSTDITQQAFTVSSKAYSDHQTANFTQRINNDPFVIFDNMASFMETVSGLITSAIVVGYIIFVNFYIGLVLIASVIICSFIETYRKRKHKKLSKEAKRRNEKYSSLLNEVVRSERDIKSLNLEANLKDNISESFDNCNNYNYKVNMFYNKWWILRSAVSRIFNAAALILGIYFMDLGLLTLASYMIIQNNRGYVFDLLTAYEQLTKHFSEISLAVNRVSELYEDDEYELEKFGTKNRKHIKGKIAFKDVGFTYVEYRDKTAQEFKLEKQSNKRQHIKTKISRRVEAGRNRVFDDLSFEIQPNTTVAFVGKSGSGKSTILSLISKMYVVDDGKITIDGVNINDLDKESLRSSIALVNQFPYIFDMTIKENLLLAKPNATEKELNQVLKDSALDEFVAGLREGINSRVGESGIKLSGGQRQRLAIARALLKKSSIILFDESTSSLDNLAQNQIKKSIDNIKGKSTIVIVAHRLSTIKNVDKIFFLENGVIVDEGTFDELFKRNKAFKTMFLAENI